MVKEWCVSAGCGRNVWQESETQPEEWAPATHVSASRILTAILQCVFCAVAHGLVTLYSNYEKFHVFIRALRNVFYVVDCMKRNTVKSLPVNNISS